MRADTSEDTRARHHQTPATEREGGWLGGKGRQEWGPDKYSPFSSQRSEFPYTLSILIPNSRATGSIISCVWGHIVTLLSLIARSGNEIRGHGLTHCRRQQVASNSKGGGGMRAGNLEAAADQVHGDFP
jgi:hypothetical protein